MKGTPLPRTGDYCTSTGIKRRDCRCATCVEFQVELKKWNSRLAGDGLGVEAGTQIEASRRDLRKKINQDHRQTNRTHK